MTFSTVSIDADNSTVISGDTWGYISWPQVSGASLYQWSVSGGSSPTSTSNTHINLSSLTVGIEVQVFIRPVNSVGETGAWTVISINPSLANSYSNLGSVTSRDWILNSLRDSSAYDPTISTVFLYTGQNLIGGAASKLVMPRGDSGCITFDASMVVGGSYCEAGFVDSSAGTSLIGGTWPSGSMSLTPSLKFTGIRFSTNSSAPGVSAFIDGVELSSISTSNPATGGYAEYRVTYSIEGLVTTVSAYRNGVLLLSATGSVPTSNNYRVAIAGGAAGSPGNYQVRGLVSWERLNLTNSLVPRVRAFAYNEGLIAVWDRRESATSYEYSINGGTTYTSTSNNYIKITGLSNSSTYNFVVRAKNSFSTSATSDAIQITPTPLPSYLARVLWDGADIFLGFNEAHGPLAYNEGLSRRHFIKSETTDATFGSAPITNDVDGKSVTTVGNLVAHRHFYTPSSSNNSTEIWLRIPNNQVKGRIFTSPISDGIVLGIGGTSTEFVGREIIFGYNGRSSVRTPIPSYKESQNGRVHIVVTKSGSVVTMYVNGVSTISGTSTTTAVLDGLIFVSDIEHAVSSNVSIDSISRYTTALTASQVNDHFLSGIKLDEIAISNSIETFQGNNEAVARWSNVLGTTYYDISVDGGDTVLSTVPSLIETASQSYSTSEYKTVSGLANGATTNIQVRPRNYLQNSSLSSWSSTKSVTPSSSKFIYFLDNFNRPSVATSIGSPQFGSEYTINAGVWGVDTNGGGYKSNSVVRSTITTTSHKNIHALFKCITNTNDSIGFLFRATDASHYWALEKDPLDPKIRLVYYNGSVDTVIWSSGPITFPSSLSIITYEQFIAIKIEDVTVFTFEDPNYSPIFNYLMGYRTNSSSTAPLIDDVVVWRLDQIDSSYWQGLDDKNAHVFKGYDKHANSSESAA